MEGEIITKEKHPDVYEWLIENVINYNFITSMQKCFTVTSDKKINAYCNIDLTYSNWSNKFHFGHVKGFFSCSHCKINSFIGLPKEIDWWFECVECENLTSLIGFPKKIKDNIYLANKKFSNSKLEKQNYNRYVNMWLDLLESASDDEKIEYLNNYKDKRDYYNNEFIIPKDVVNKYKIDFLLKDK